MSYQPSSGSKVTRRLILRRCPAREEIGAFVAGRDGEQASSEWLDSTQKLQYRITWNLGSDTYVWYTEDNIADCCYIQVASNDMTFASDLLHAAEGELDTRSREELLREVDEANDPTSRGIALIRLGVSASVRFDEEIYSRIIANLYSEYEELRDMAVWASSYSPYKEYRPDLEELCVDDPSEKIQSRARTVLRIFDHMGIGSE